MCRVKECASGMELARIRKNMRMHKFRRPPLTSRPYCMHRKYVTPDASRPVLCTFVYRLYSSAPHRVHKQAVAVECHWWFGILHSGGLTPLIHQSDWCAATVLALALLSYTARRAGLRMYDVAVAPITHSLCMWEHKHGINAVHDLLYTCCRLRRHDGQARQYTCSDLFSDNACAQLQVAGRTAPQRICQFQL